MNIIKVLLSIFIFMLVTLAFGYIDANAQFYAPVGPQTNVPVSTVTGGGWTECYRDTYANDMDSDVVLSDCPGDLLMLACRTTGSDTLTLLAQGKRSDATFDTGDNTNVTHIANRVGWYFSKVVLGSTGSWGFVRAGDIPHKVPCDNSSGGANNERLCWHIKNILADGGWRCGAAQSLNIATNIERIVYAASPQQSINLSPTTATNEILTDHTVTATVLTNGVPFSGEIVTFQIISGPNAGETSDPNNGECTPNDDCTTDSNGEVSWTYTGRSSLGNDMIVASFDGFETVIESNTVEKTWVVSPRPIPTLSEWGLIAMTAILGIAGFIVIRRRKVTA